MGAGEATTCLRVGSSGNRCLNFSDPFGLCPPADDVDGPWCHSPGYWLTTTLGILSPETATKVFQIGYNAAMMVGGVNLAWPGSGIVPLEGGGGQALGLTSKGAAREALGTLGVEGEHAAAANRAIGRATSSSTIDVVKQGNGNVIVRVARPGQSGYQVMESTVAPNGSKTVVQRAYDSQGNLVHEDPKTPQ